MTNSTLEVDAGAGSQPRLLFGFQPLHEELRRLRQEAIAEVVMLQPEPAEKKGDLLTYNSPRPCMEMPKILENQVLVQPAFSSLPCSNAWFRLAWSS